MKTRLRRHTELERERETQTRDVSEEARRDPLSPEDPATSPDQSSRPRPAEWTVDQVWEFISSLPGWLATRATLNRIVSQRLASKPNQTSKKPVWPSNGSTLKQALQ